MRKKNSKLEKLRRRHRELEEETNELKKKMKNAINLQESYSEAVS